MIINSNNIQKWLFDYFEGNLTTLEKSEMEQFILGNPQYHNEFIAWKESVQESQNDEDTPVFSGMNGLLVTVPFYQTLAFKYVAGLLFLIATTFGGLYYNNTTNIHQSNATNYSTTSFDFEQIEKTPRLIFAPKTTILDFKTTINNSSNYKTTPENTTNTTRLIQTLVANISQNKAPNNLTSYNSTNNTPYLFSNIINSLRNNKHQFNTLKSIKNHNLKPSNSNIKKRKNKHPNHLASSNKEINSSKKKKYNYLNFKTSNLHSKSDLDREIKHKKEGGTNFAIISQINIFKKSDNKKQKNHKPRFKNVELGLGNINDPIFILSDNHLLNLNPSLTGQLGHSRIKSSYRNQFYNQLGNVQIIRNSFDTYIKGINAGVGIQQSFIKSNDVDIASYHVTYAQKIVIDRETNLSITLDGSYETIFHSNQSNFMELNAGTMLNTSNLSNNKEQYNIGLSTWYSNKYFYGGINVTNLLNPSLYATQEQQSWMNQINYSIQLGTDYKKSLFATTVISPFVVYNKMGNKKEIWAGSSLRYKSLIVGLSGSSTLKGKAIIGLQSESFRLTYGFDYANSDINHKYIGSHELSLRLLFGNRKNNLLRYEN